MGWLRKSRQRDEEVEQVESDELEKEEKEIPLAYGPRDWADADESEDLVDMGAIRLPAIEGMQVTLIPSTGTELDTVVAALGGSSIELRAFAAPRSEKLWPQVREAWQRAQNSGFRTMPALSAAVAEIRAHMEKGWGVPHRFTASMREIWQLQPQFEHRRGARPFRLLAQSRFRAKTPGGDTDQRSRARTQRA